MGNHYTIKSCIFWMSIYLQCRLKLHKLLKLQCLPRNGQNVVRFEFFCFSIPYRCENKSNRWACPPLAMMYHAVQSLKIEMDFFKQYYVKKFIFPEKKLPIIVKVKVIDRSCNDVKFMFSKKATKIDEIFTIDLTFTT